MLSTLAMCFLLATMADRPPQPVNLALFASGGIPTAVSSAAHIAFSAQRAADGRADTQWVAGPVQEPLWLRVEWQAPVVVERVTIRLGRWKGRPSALRRCVIEARQDCQWRALTTLDPRQLLDTPIHVPLSAPCHTRAVRVIVESATSDPVTISELELFGPRPISPLDFAPAWRGAGAGPPCTTCSRSGPSRPPTGSR